MQTSGPTADSGSIDRMQKRIVPVLFVVLFAVSASAAEPNVYPMHDGFVDANGVLIYYMTLGKGDPLVIVHGGPGASHDYFLPWLLPLARHNRVVFIDERG